MKHTLILILLMNTVFAGPLLDKKLADEVKAPNAVYYFNSEDNVVIPAPSKEDCKDQCDNSWFCNPSFFLMMVGVGLVSGLIIGLEVKQ